MIDILNNTYFGNTLLNYTLFLVTIGVFLLIGKSAHYFVIKYLRKITKKTKSSLDDKFLDLLDGPLIYLFVIMGFFVGYHFLTFGDTINEIYYNILNILIILLVTWVSLRFIDKILVSYLRRIIDKTDSKLDDQLLPIIQKILKFIVIALSIVVIISSFGYDVTAILAGLGIGGLAFAFAAQKTLSDVFGGFSIFTSKPFIVGDLVTVNGITGKIEEVGLRHTRIRTFDNRRITISNSTISESVIENISSEPSRRIKMTLGLTYDTKPEKMKEAIDLIKKIVDEHPDCEKGTANITFDEFGDFSLNLLVIYYISNKNNWMQAKGEINQRILEEFNKRGLEFAFPTQTIYMQK